MRGHLIHRITAPVRFAIRFPYREFHRRRRLRSRITEENMQWYLDVLKNYALFTGRARRSEYWYFVLFNVAVVLVLGIVDAVVRKITGFSFGLFGALYGLAILVPAIAVGVRRLHDTNRSG